MMKTRHRIVLWLSVTLIGMFFLGESEPVHVFLRGTAPSSETPFMADDRYVGAGLAPFAYCLFPACALILYAGVSMVVGRRHSGSR
jgi:hypothetical protein